MSEGKKDDSVPPTETEGSASTDRYPIADDSGTSTKFTKLGMADAKSRSDACICMWGELNDANDGKVTNFNVLADLMVRNMKEYVTTGEVASGKLPFAVQFCSPGWLPLMENDRLIKLREFFCQMTRDAIFTATKDDKGREHLANTLRNKKVNILETSEEYVRSYRQAVRSWHGATRMCKVLCVSGCADP